MRLGLQREVMQLTNAASKKPKSLKKDFMPCISVNEYNERTPLATALVST